MCRTSIYEARNNLSGFVKIAESGEAVELTRYDKPVAVIVSYEEYEKMEEKPSLIERLAKLKAEYCDVINDERIPLREKECPEADRVIFKD